MTTPQWLIVIALLILAVNNFTAIKVFFKNKRRCKTP